MRAKPKITIIAEPVAVRSQTGRLIDLICPCSDGKARNLLELNKIACLSSHYTLKDRIKTNGWDHPYILSGPAKRGHKLDGTRASHGKVRSGEKNMSDKPRTKNLLRIPGPGILEAKYYV